MGAGNEESESVTDDRRWGRVSTDVPAAQETEAGGASESRSFRTARIIVRLSKN